MPLLSVTSSLQGQKWRTPHPPSLVAMQPSAGRACELGKSAPCGCNSSAKPEKPLSLCSSPQPVQANLCFSQDKTAVSARHSFAEILAHSGGCKAIQACWAGAKLASQNPVSLVSVGSCCHRTAGGGTMIPCHQWVQGQGNLHAFEDNDFNVVGVILPSVPF